MNSSLDQESQILKKKGSFIPKNYLNTNIKTASSN